MQLLYIGTTLDTFKASGQIPYSMEIANRYTIEQLQRKPY